MGCDRTPSLNAVRHGLLYALVALQMVAYDIMGGYCGVGGDHGRLPVALDLVVHGLIRRFYRNLEFRFKLQR